MKGHKYEIKTGKFREEDLERISKKEKVIIIVRHQVVQTIRFVCKNLSKLLSNLASPY